MVPEQQLRGDTTVASMLLGPSSSSTTVPGISENPSDVNLFRSDVPPSQHLPIPESDALVDNVLINRLNILYILKPVLP
jgi:hypothetical protein